MVRKKPAKKKRTLKKSAPKRTSRAAKPKTKSRKTSPKKRKKVSSKKRAAKKQPKKRGKKRPAKKRPARRTKPRASRSRAAPQKEKPKSTTPQLPKVTGPFETAESMAKAQRTISVSEFFAKNRHLLGFDNPRKALLTTVKEAVDNALDACEEAGILPVVEIRIEQLSETHFKVTVQDNGPGIVRKQIPNIFGKLLYESKFHRLRMSRGQQGIGISAAGMYGLLTTGRPVKITSRTSPRAKAHHYELQIDTRKNQPDIIQDETVDWDARHGTRVEIELEARYQRGRQSVDDYLQQTAIANPHVTLTYHTPDGRTDTYKATVKHLPATPKSIRPHPHGIELGVLIKMLQDTKARSVRQFLISEFSRVSPRVAHQIIEASGIRVNARASSLDGDGAKGIYGAIQETRILAPSTDCVVPIGEQQLLAGLKQVVPAAFYTATTRRPAVYRGNPFVIEAAIAYGKREEPPEAETSETAQEAPPAKEQDTQLAKIIRFANRVPLQYQQSGCATYKAVVGMNWRLYRLGQARGALPSGDLTVVVHMGSVWVPFTSESKEAIASYPEILKEIRLALQECGRKLGTHIRKTVRIRQELKKRSYIEKYIPAIGEALRDILDLKERSVRRVCNDLKDVLQRSRKL